MFTSDKEFLFTRILNTVIRCNLSQYISSNDVNHDLLMKSICLITLPVLRKHCISKIVCKTLQL